MFACIYNVREFSYVYVENYLFATTVFAVWKRINFLENRETVPAKEINECKMSKIKLFEINEL